MGQQILVIHWYNTIDISFPSPFSGPVTRSSNYQFKGKVIYFFQNQHQSYHFYWHIFDMPAWSTVNKVWVMVPRRLNLFLAEKLLIFVLLSVQ